MPVGDGGGSSGLLELFSRGRTSLETEERKPVVSSALRFLVATACRGVLLAPAVRGTQG